MRALLRSIRLRFGALRHRGRLRRDLEDEISFHLAAKADRLRADGVEDAQAARLARRQFGNPARLRETLHDLWTFRWIEVLSQDVRHAVRAVGRQPSFATVALLTLAIGIGANTAVFSVVNGVLLEPLPYPEPAALVTVVTAAPGAPSPSGGPGGIPDLPESVSMFFTYAEENRSFAHIGLWSVFSTTVTGLAEPEQVRTVGVTDGTLEALGVSPVLGRRLAPEDQAPETPETVMLGYGYWQRRFGGDASVIGRHLTVESRPREIVGVMPREFRVVRAEPEVIIPFKFDRSRQLLVPFNFQTVARLAPGVSPAAADADLARLIPVWMDSWSMPPGFGGDGRGAFARWRLTPTVRPLKDAVVGSAGTVLWILMGTIGIVLLIACANVSNLLLVRAEGRQRELAIRAALGAGAGRLMWSLLIESLVLGVLGGALGLGVAAGGVRLLVAIGPSSLPRLHEIAIDGRALGFALGASLLSGLVFGLLPAFRHAGPRIAAALLAGGRAASESRERRRVRHSLVVAQVALALVLLVSAGLMIRTFQALHAVDPGFTQPDQLQTVRIAIPFSRGLEPAQVARQHAAVLERLAAVPGVTSAAYASALPMEGLLPSPVLSTRSPLVAESDTREAADARPLRWFRFVSPGYFQTTGTQILAGRDYTWTDLESRQPLAIVSENLARELWGSPAAALGERIRSLPDTPWREVIGVVQDVREEGVHRPAPSIVYWPSVMEGLTEAGQVDVPRAVTLAIRTARAGTESFLAEVREAVWAVDASLPVASARTLREVYDYSLAQTSFALVMLAIAGTMALALGIVGIYGVLSYTVSQRTREMGIRLALGAPRSGIRRMLLRHGLGLTAVGIAIGLVAAAGLTRLLTSLLFEVRPLDPVTYGAVVVVLVGAALLASYLPARRASGVDPVGALRAE